MDGRQWRLAGLLVLLLEGAGAGEIYSWKDRDGRVHFGDKPVQAAENVRLSNARAGKVYQAQALLGDWLLQEDRGGTLARIRLSLQEGGRFSSQTELGQRVVQAGGGRWTLNGDRIDFVFEVEAGSKAAPRRDSDRVISLQEGRLVLLSQQGGRQRTYWRQ